MRLASLSLIAALLLAALPFAGPAAAAPATPICGKLQVEATRYTVCRAAPDEIGLHWRDARGRPYRSFGALAAGLREQGGKLVFAINAGMYDTDFRPIGLHVEDGETLVKLNSGEAPPGQTPVPNFYKKPNGVFFVADGRAGILTAEAYAATAPAARIATQSGPMLVIGGQLHPALIPGGTDRTRRSGVGVCGEGEGEGEVVFAISDGAVNFYDFALLFRDRLGCPDALFLDGGRGAGIHDPALGRNDTSWHGGYGPMLAVADAAAD